jgi:hypothetical protein
VVSVALRRPWTIMLSRWRYSAEVRSTDLFRETNSIITSGWAVYYAIAASVTAFSPAWTGLVFAVTAIPLTLVAFVFGARHSASKLRALGLDPNAFA